MTGMDGQTQKAKEPTGPNRPKEQHTLLGTNWNNGSNAGAWNWNLNNGSGNSNRNIGTHLCFVDGPIQLTEQRCRRLRPAPWQNKYQECRAGRAPAGASRTLGTTHKSGAAS